MMYVLNLLRYFFSVYAQNSVNTLRTEAMQEVCVYQVLDYIVYIIYYMTQYSGIVHRSTQRWKACNTKIIICELRSLQSFVKSISSDKQRIKSLHKA